MTDETEKPDSGLYKQTIHFTPHGTEVRYELTEEGRKQQKLATDAQVQGSAPQVNKEKVRDTFNRFASLPLRNKFNKSAKGP